MMNTNLLESVLIEPAKNGCNKLLIASGYGSATMASYHIENLLKFNQDIRIQLILGMPIKEGIVKKDHLGFKELSSINYITKFECRYLAKLPQMHSKLYIWLNNDVPKLSFIGSANYTQLAFSHNQRELMTKSNIIESLNYYQSIYNDSIDCRDSNAENLFNIYEEKFYKSFIKKRSIEKSESDIFVDSQFDNFNNLDKITISLLDNNGKLPEHSGLNWAFRTKYTRHDRNQAYIRVPANIAKSDYFPEIAKHFTVLTDDDKPLICCIAQQGRKGIHTPLNNGIMGEYFRNRLGLPNGSFITTEDLVSYGRTDVDFYKIDNETYFLDFSV